jgi:hypothetical protein
MTRFAGTETNAPFVLQGTYFGRQRFEGVEERDGLRMHFAGWSQPLEAYATALEGAGLAITSLREPIPQAGDGWNHMQRWAQVEGTALDIEMIGWRLVTTFYTYPEPTPS